MSSRPATRSYWLIGSALALCACTIPNGQWEADHPSSSADSELLIDVSFNGVAGCSDAGVDGVSISFPNGEIASETVQCGVRGVQFDVVPIPTGKHRITVQGLAHGKAIFSLTQDVVVQAGSQEIAMDLAPGSTSTAQATLLIGVQFDTRTICAAAGVDQVRLTFPNGESQNETVSCSTLAVQFTVSALTVGVHRITVDGLTQGQVTFTLTTDVTLAAAGSSVTLNLAAVNSSQQASFIARFVFGAPQSSDPNPAGMTCAEAGVQSVSVTIDNGQPLVALCHDTTSGLDGALVPVAAGAHSFAWSAWDSPNGTGNELYAAAAATVTIQSGSSQQVPVNMAGLENGGFTAAWQFPTGQSCAAVGAATVTFDIADSLGNELPGMPVTRSCSSLAYSVPIAPGLTPGVFALVSMKAENANQMVLFQASNIRLYAPAGGQASFTVPLSP